MVSSLEKYRGVLDLEAARGKYTLARYWPAPDVGCFVERYWIVRWNLGDGPPYVQTTLPNPCVNLVVEPGGSRVYGVMTGAYRRVLAGNGVAFGVKFKPAGFYPYFGKPLARLVNGAARMDEVFGPAGAELERKLPALADDAAMVEEAEAFLRGRLPRIDRNVALIDGIVEQIAADPSIRKVRDLALAAGRSERTLQRLFAKYVGVGPRWVIARYRLQEAAHRIEEGSVDDWAALAADLGYADQPHFIRDFKSLVGKTPAEYAREVGMRRQRLASSRM